MKRAFKRPQTIVYRACRIVAMRLTYTSAQDFPTVLPVRVSRRPLTEFTPLVPYCWSWAGQGSRQGEELEGGSSSVGRRRKRFARERSDRIRICRKGFVAFRGCRRKRSVFVERSTSWGTSLQRFEAGERHLFWAKLIYYFWRSFGGRYRKCSIETTGFYRFKFVLS